MDRTLIAIPTTDRDADHIADCYGTLCESAARCLSVRGKDAAEFHLLVMPRESDVQSLERWSRIRDAGGLIPVEIRTFDPYVIEGRHNMPAIARKRTFAMQAARERGFDYVLFVDSDIIVGNETLTRLFDAFRHGCDLALAAYEVKWLGYPAVGVRQGDHFQILDLSDPANNQPGFVHVVGMGCTMIGRSCFDVPFEERKIFDRDGVFNEGPDAGVRGEDIGFCLNCLQRGKTLYYTGEIVTHR
jgi:hypothetical protein